MKSIQILLTNDDGIQSPGLWAAAETLSSLGFVNVAAPRDQFSGAGRSLPLDSDGIITAHQMNVNGKDWRVFSVGGTPAQAVLHALIEILEEKPCLVVSGINYGENIGSGITISGTVGAALEAASMGIPGLAVSLQTAPENYLSYSTSVNFSAAAYFTAYFARLMLGKRLPPDVQVLNINIPAGATPQTPWEITRLSMQRYYEPLPTQRASWDIPGSMGFKVMCDPLRDPPDTDVYAIQVKKRVSVTPLSLDMTSRVDLQELDSSLRKAE
jgi:5'-nucleotidase